LEIDDDQNIEWKSSVANACGDMKWFLIIFDINNDIVLILPSITSGRSSFWPNGEWGSK